MDEMTFKYRYVKNGNARTLMSKAGRAGSDGLTLDGKLVAYDRIVDTTTRDNRLVVTLDAAQLLDESMAKAAGQKEFFILEVYRQPALQLERFIDRQCATGASDRNKRRLEAEGKAHLFRTESCPECHSVIDLSERDKTPYIYCRFCETVFSSDGQHVTRGQEYRVCDQCHMFDRVRPYTEFYFYFLVVAYGFHFRRRHLCDVCVGTLFWKVFLVNAPFFLGVPSAIWMKIKSVSGRQRDLVELATANKLAKRGKMAQASPIYAKLQERLGGHPGLYMNEGMGFMAGASADQAAVVFAQSLKSCSNYVPTLVQQKQLSALGQAPSQRRLG